MASSVSGQIAFEFADREGKATIEIYHNGVKILHLDYMDHVTLIQDLNLFASKKKWIGCDLELSFSLMVGKISFISKKPEALTKIVDAY